MYYFDEATKCFLSDEVNIIPDSAFPVTDEQWSELVELRNQGTFIYVVDGDVKATPIRPSAAHSWNGNAWVIDTDTHAALKIAMQNTMRQAINAKRDATDAGGVYIASLDKWIDSDAAAYQNILSVKATFDLIGDMEIPWTWADNSNSTINKDDLVIIVSTLLQTKQANHANALAHKKAMLALDNPEDYDYSSGWTKTYADYLAEQDDE